MKKTMREKAAKKITAYRTRELKIRPSEFARRLGVSRQYYRFVELGKIFPGQKMMSALQKMGFDVRALFT